ncbi:SIR2 family protein [Staphylococcus simulans]|uniref:SIR2 family protein n=1 Tax=Staphylococcus simulans TaxID=1286 RepID=UPI000D02B252|nr:SIR2 family protein [Staphylococcus simulans]
MTKVNIMFGKNKNISYDSKNVYLNNAPLIDKEERKKECQDIDFKEFAENVMREKYKAILSKQYENVVVLTGAGSSIGFGGKSMYNLWDEVVDKVGCKEFKDFCSNVQFKGIDSKNLEDLLSNAERYTSIFNDKQEVIDTMNEIKDIIKSECTIENVGGEVHLSFLRKLSARKLKYNRPKIFTLNYDTLFEQAASLGGFIVIDGFSFSSPRQFNGIYFDYDIISRNTHAILTDENYVSQVVHIYKPHGSIDWEETEERIIKNDGTSNPLMIYPSTNKYENSYKQPFFEMVSRFQGELRKKNTLLMVIGFSFGDNHIEAMIEEAMNVNGSLTVLIVSPGVKSDEKDENNDNYHKYREKSKVLDSIYLVSEKFESFVNNYPDSQIYSYYYQGENTTNESI